MVVAHFPLTGVHYWEEGNYAMDHELMNYCNKTHKMKSTMYNNYVNKNKVKKLNCYQILC